MWIDQLQNWINIVVIFVVSTLGTAFAKIYLEKIIFTKKLLDFASHLIPTIIFFLASTSKEVCHWVGLLIGFSDVAGFYCLIWFGFMSLTTTLLFLFEISRNDAVSKK